MNYHTRFAQDRDFRSARSAFIRAKKLATNYGVRLRKIASNINTIVQGFEDDILARAALVQAQLHRYAETLTPWGEATADRMIAEVAQNDRQAWRRVSAEMGRALHREIENAPTGAVMRQLKADQVGLIKSLPLDAAERIHRLTTEGISKGMRAEEVAQEIMRSGDVARSRATLIARTETSRTATLLTQSRAQYIGATHFKWLTAGDNDVRPSHKRLNGLTFRWDSPPECDPGHHALPGCIWNCRCTAIPVLDNL